VISTTDSEQVTLGRLDDQIAWYGRKSSVNQRRFKSMKAITIVSAAIIPVLSTSGVSHGGDIAAGLGVLIAVIEGLQQLNQYHASWTNYRSTGESLKHEKYLYLAKAGLYRAPDNSQLLLAERVETLISQEGSKWLNLHIDKPREPGAQ
jgi:hypothetical protein